MIETNNNFNEKEDSPLSTINKTHDEELAKNLSINPSIINCFDNLFTEGSELILNMEDFLSKNKNEFNNEYKKLTEDTKKKQYLYRRINYIDSERNYFNNRYHRIRDGVWTLIKWHGNQEEQNIYQQKLNSLGRLWFSIYRDINHMYFKYKDIYNDSNLTI